MSSTSDFWYLYLLRYRSVRDQPVDRWYKNRRSAIFNMRVISKENMGVDLKVWRFVVPKIVSAPAPSHLEVVLYALNMLAGPGQQQKNIDRVMATDAGTPLAHERLAEYIENKKAEMAEKAEEEIEREQQ